MKRLIASFAAFGLIAAPAVAVTKSGSTTTSSPAKPTKAQAKAATKSAKGNVRAAKAAPSTTKKSS